MTLWWVETMISTLQGISFRFGAFCECDGVFNECRNGAEVYLITQEQDYFVYVFRVNLLYFVKEVIMKLLSFYSLVRHQENE